MDPPVVFKNSETKYTKSEVFKISHYMKMALTEVQQVITNPLVSYIPSQRDVKENLRTAE